MKEKTTRFLLLSLLRRCEVNKNSLRELLMTRKKIRLMYITKEECDTLPPELRQHFSKAEQLIGNKTLCVANLSKYLVDKTQEYLKKSNQSKK